MKYLTLLTLFLFTGLCSFAQEDLPMPMLKEQHKTKSLQEHVSNLKYQNTSWKTRADENDRPIYTAPEGDKVYYSRTAVGYYEGWDALDWGEREGGINITYANDGYAYIHNPVAGLATNSYLRGQVEGKQLKVSLPQLVGIESDFDNPGEQLYFYIAVVKKESDNLGDYYTVTQDDVAYNIAANGNLSLNMAQGEELSDEVLLGLIDDRGTLYSGDVTQELTKVELYPVTPPENIEAEAWQLYYLGEPHQVQMAVDGNDVYLCNFDYIYVPGTWIKGTKTGNEYSFPSGQFLRETGGYFYYFLGADYENRSYTILPEIVFTYDEEKKLMTCPENYSMIANPNDKSVSLDYPEFMAYIDPALKSITGEAASQIPQNPVFVAYLDYRDWAGGMFFSEFDLYATSIYYDPIDTKQLYYRIYVDGSPLQVFGSEGTNYDFPYGFYGEKDRYMSIFQFGTNVVLYLYFFDCESLGFQLINKTPEGEIFESEIVTYYVTLDQVITSDGSGVTKYRTDDIISSEYYDLNGIKCGENKKGLVIVKDRHLDGSVTSRKLFKR